MIFLRHLLPTHLYKHRSHIQEKNHNQLTCSNYSSKNPALAILYRGTVVFMVFLQDFNTSTPNCWRISTWIVSWPVSHQNTMVIKWVDLNQYRKKFFFNILKGLKLQKWDLLFYMCMCANILTTLSNASSSVAHSHINMLTVVMLKWCDDNFKQIQYLLCVMFLHSTIY